MSGTITIIVSSSISGGLGRAAPIFPVLIMLIYCVLIWKSGMVSEDAGDSLYYLGFAFTLVALIVALAGTFFNQQAIELRLIVKAFGIALSTTVIGLVLRIILLSFVDDRTGRELPELAYEDAMTALQELQMEVQNTVQTLSKWRTEAAEHWRTVREEEMGSVQEVLGVHKRFLSEQAATFQTKLTDAYSGLEKYSEDALSKIRTAAEEATEQVKEVALSGVGEIGAVAAAVQQTLQAALSTWVTEIGKAAESVGTDVAKQIEGGFAKVVEASEALAESFAGAAQRLSEVHFDRINQALEEAQRLTVDGFSELSQKVSGLGDQLVASFPSEGEYRKSFDVLNASLASAVEKNRVAMDHMQVATVETVALFTKVGEELKNAGQTLGFEEVRSSVQSLAQSMNLHKESIATTGEALTQIDTDLARVVQSVPSLAAVLENMGAELGSELRDIGELQRQLRVARQAMIQDLTSSEKALREVMNTLTEGVRQLRGEIKSERTR